MKIFIAHSDFDLERKVALTLAQRLHASGHNTFVGDSADFTPSITWILSSFRHNRVKENLNKSDILIAVCLAEKWLETNVSAEISYFLARSSRNNIIIIKREEAALPTYLESPFIIIYKEPMDEIFSLLESKLELIAKESIKARGQVFLSYSRQDGDVAENINNHLTRDGFKVWFDKNNLEVGQDWNLEIVWAIRQSAAIIILLSSQSVNKRGYFQKELKRSLEVAEEVPEGEIYILPVKLDDCAVPEALTKYQWCQYQDEKGYDQLSRALEKVLNDYSERANNGRAL
jgi:hypothetical protein